MNEDEGYLINTDRSRIYEGISRILEIIGYQSERNGKIEDARGGCKNVEIFSVASEKDRGFTVFDRDAVVFHDDRSA